jgi:protein O-GlcNAc transferase
VVPRDLQHIIQQGLALHRSDKLSEAQSCYQLILEHDPNHIDALHLLGVVKGQLGEKEESLRLIEQAVARAPNAPLVLVNHGRALTALGRDAEAIGSYDRAIALQPRHFEAWAHKGNALLTTDRPEEALKAYDRALELDPSFFSIWFRRGKALSKLGRDEDAIKSYMQALALKPDSVEVLHHLGNSFAYQGDLKQAIAYLDRAVRLSPNNISVRFDRCTAELPVVYETEAEIAQQRLLYSQQLRNLAEDLDGLASLDCPESEIVSMPPFFLAYQGENNRELQTLHGSAICRVMSRYANTEGRHASPPMPTERVRVGMVSAFFREHSNWKIPIKGWVSQLDRGRFQLFGYHVSAIQDAQTAQARSMFDRFVQGPLALPAWREAILRDSPHVLIYPEIGMDSVVHKLAAQRLAPVQCNSWGHPDTSGFPSMDYFLSSDLMEPIDGQQHYTERLIRLPNLSIYYDEVVADSSFATSREKLGLRRASTVFWCAQTLYKYLPQHDFVFPRIAKEVGDCQFVFVGLSDRRYSNDLFKKRLGRAFAEFDLRLEDHCVFLPYTPYPQFIAAMGLSDIFLDSIGWSGCNSALESLAHDLPIVTMTGPLMRARHSTAILTMIGMTETIAATVEAYIAMAVRTALDASWRRSLRHRMGQQKYRVYRDRACITALEHFLDGAVRADHGVVGPTTK